MSEITITVELLAYVRVNEWEGLTCTVLDDPRFQLDPKIMEERKYEKMVTEEIQFKYENKIWIQLTNETIDGFNEFKNDIVLHYLNSFLPPDTIPANTIKNIENQIVCTNCVYGTIIQEID